MPLFSIKPSALYFFAKSLLKDTFFTAITIFKIMIPVSIGVKLLEITGLLEVIGKLFSPIMQLVNLPDNTGIVWASAMLSNIYGGMIAYATISSQLQLNEGQITVLSLMMLVAHTFPIELQVAYRAGVRVWVIFAIRFGFALLAGIVLNIIYQAGNWGKATTHFHAIASKPTRSVLEWLLNEGERYIYIILSIFCLLLIMKILKKIGLLQHLSNALAPIVSVLGISKTVIPMTVIGLTTGLLYGGVLIIKEAQEKQIPKLDIFYAMLLMGLCHALIEDTLLMIALGADFNGVFTFRIIFAIMVTYTVVRVCKLFKVGKLEKLLTRQSNRENEI
jgi:hypothetical protein